MFIVFARMRRWSISTRLFALQFVFILVLTAAALVWLYNDSQGIVEGNAADRSLSVATSIADNPFVVEAVQSASSGADPSTVLEPYAQHLMADTSTDFITIMAPDRTRYTHPNIAEIGKPFVGTIEPALEGRSFTETYSGTLGPSVRAVVPIRDSGGTIVALVAAGVTVSKVGVALGERLPLVFGFAALTLLFGALASWLLSRYLRRVTWGRGPEEMSRMFLYYEGVLHSVREGLVLVDPRGRLVLANDQAATLLGLGSAPNHPVAVTELQVPDALRTLLASGARAVDEIFVTDDRVLVVNQEPALSVGTARRAMGTVATLRDHTDLLRISGELQNMRTLSDALRSQTHEYSNRLHTIVALIELGRPDEAISLAAGELDRGQNLADQLVDAADEPVLAALLVGKSAEARERGVDLRLDVDPGLGPIGVPADDLITIVGNLVDNAFDAAIGSPRPAVAVQVRAGGDREVIIRVSDTGPGIVDVERAFERGYSSKEAGPGGRGFGLALVGQSVRRLGGSIEVTDDDGAVVTVVVPRAVNHETAASR